jgi:hypothetical protein
MGREAWPLVILSLLGCSVFTEKRLIDRKNRARRYAEAQIGQQ